MQWTQHGGESKELELELLLSHMTQKPMLRGEVGARALRVRSDVRGHGQARLSRRLIHAAAEALYLPPEHSRRTHRSQDCRTPQQHVRRP